MKNALLISLLLLFTLRVSAGTNTYECYLKNITVVDSRTMDFDIWLEWTGSNKQAILHFGGGIDFNYQGLANGGVLTGSFVPGSADRRLPAVMQNPNWNINQESRQIRILSSVVTPASIATAIPASPGVRLGTFRIKNTTDFNFKADPEFEWSFKTGTANTTQTKVMFYLKGESTGTAVTVPSQHHVEKNSSLAAGIINSERNIEFFPNPTTSHLFISKNKGETLKELRIFNLNGQKENIRYTVNSKNDLIDLNVEGLASGVYFLEIILDNEKLTSKFVKE